MFGGDKSRFERIAAGDNIDQSLDDRLEGAETILLLVRPYFIASDHYYGREMERALERIPRSHLSSHFGDAG